MDLLGLASLPTVSDRGKRASHHYPSWQWGGMSVIAFVALGVVLEGVMKKLERECRPCFIARTLLDSLVLTRKTTLGLMPQGGRLFESWWRRWESNPRPKNASGKLLRV